MLNYRIHVVYKPTNISLGVHHPVPWWTNGFSSGRPADAKRTWIGWKFSSLDWSHGEHIYNIIESVYIVLYIIYNVIVLYIWYMYMIAKKWFSTDCPMFAEAQQKSLARFRKCLCFWWVEQVLQWKQKMVLQYFNGHFRILKWRYLPYIRPIIIRLKFQGRYPPK